jgi:hypothetical protein
MNQRIEDYLNERRRKLALIEAMWRDPFVQCYNDSEMPPIEDQLRLGSIFLAGPTPRRQTLELNWRCEAVSLVRAAEFTGYIYVPEPRGTEIATDFTERGYIYRWESSRLFGRAKKLIWVPRNAGELLGLNTNFEWGRTSGMIDSGKLDPNDVFIGWPDEAERMGLPRHYSIELDGCVRHMTLEATCYAAVGKVPPSQHSA